MDLFGSKACISRFSIVTYAILVFNVNNCKTNYKKCEVSMLAIHHENCILVYSRCSLLKREAFLIENVSVATETYQKFRSTCAATKLFYI